MGRLSALASRSLEMSLNLNPVSLGVRENFRPFQDSVASSFTRYFAFGTPARYLSLDGCEIRKILYAIYSEKGNGIHVKVKYSN